MVRAGFGTPKYGGDTSKKVGKPGKGHNPFRIMPPMGSLAAEGKWAVFHTTIWGFNGVHPTEPGKTIVRPIKSIEVSNKQGMVSQSDPLVDWINTYADETEALKAELLKEKVDLKSNEDYQNRLLWLRRFNIERKFYINCMFKPDNTGVESFGPYKINYRVHKKGIDAKIKDLLDQESIDALDLDQGVWFDIVRTGNGVDPPDTVEVEMEDFEIEHQGKKMKVKRYVPAALTEEQSTRALAECPDLNTLGGTVLSFTQMKALSECSLDPREVDEIFGGPVGGSRTSTVRSSAVSKPTPETELPETKLKSEGQPAEPDINDPAIQARLAAIKAKKAAEAQAKAEAEVALAKQKAAEEAAAAELRRQAAIMTNPASAIDDDEEFLRKFGG
ncbi:MAG TPA: hypothetical protein VHD33_07410 [Legionellaceae bacterium]|nr:hypothetical protein [Legionellaceae bacterium]